MFGDLRFGIRMLAKRPGASALAVVALALGIGLTTIMFSIVEGVILRGLPFDESDRILYVGRFSRTQPGEEIQPASIHDFEDWRRLQRSFEDLAGFAQVDATITAGIGPERYPAARITPNLLRLLRTAPLLGRAFTDEDARSGAEAVALIGHSVWQTQFARNPNVIGQAVRINGTPAVIVGVMPQGFGFPQAQQVWLPMSGEATAPRRAAQRPATPPGLDGVEVVGRLASGVSAADATAEFDVISRRLEAEHIENKNLGARAIPFIDRFLGEEVSRTFYAMLAAVFGVMLIACANVTNLQLARAAERMREVAVRTALGAGRGRIIRQLLIEGLLLSSAGAAIGLGLAAGGIRLFNAAIPDTSPPFWIDIRIDVVVLAVVAALTVVAALAASLVPALRATRQDVNAVLKDEGRAQTSLQMGRLSRWLVVGEVLVSCTLLVVSGLAVKSIVAASRVVYPYEVDRMFAARVSADVTTYPDAVSRTRLAEAIETRLAGVAGMTAVTLTTGTPQQMWIGPLAVEGRTVADGQRGPLVRRLAVTPSFFDTFQVSVRSGRALAPGDAHGGLPVAVITEDAARALFPDGDAIGRRVQFGFADEPWLTIVGVSSALVPAGHSPIRDVLLVPLAQHPSTDLTVIARTAVDPRSLTSEVRHALLEVDRDLPLSNADALAAWYARDSWAVYVFGGLFLSFGLAAQVLASAGLYGVTAFHVERRTQEIGVRMALGADRGTILRMVLWQSLWRVGLGIALGLIPAWLLAHVMREILFNVEPGDLVVFGATIAGLVLTGLAAAAVPARRAASVDPLVALRRE
jgi:putative ABC transport system permease protein